MNYAETRQRGRIKPFVLKKTNYLVDSADCVHSFIQTLNKDRIKKS